MAARITVDSAALRAAAAEVDAMAGSVALRRQALAGPLVEAEQHLAGAASGRLTGRIADAVVDVHGDLATALGGLAEGLERVVDVFTEVDEVTAAQARAWWRGTGAG